MDNRPNIHIDHRIVRSLEYMRMMAMNNRHIAVEQISLSNRVHIRYHIRLSSR
jgi:hypothetical protein